MLLAEQRPSENSIICHSGHRAGIYIPLIKRVLDSRLRGNDRKKSFRTVSGRNFFGHYAKTVRFGQKWYLATVPLTQNL